MTTEPPLPSDLAGWLREEALNWKKMLSGAPRLNYIEWKRQRDERARTMKGGSS